MLIADVKKRRMDVTKCVYRVRRTCTHSGVAATERAATQPKKKSFVEKCALCIVCSKELLYTLRFHHHTNEKRTWFGNEYKNPYAKYENWLPQQHALGVGVYVRLGELTLPRARLRVHFFHCTNRFALILTTCFGLRVCEFFFYFQFCRRTLKIAPKMCLAGSASCIWNIKQNSNKLYQC